MNNSVGYARPARCRNPVVLGTDGIGADMLEEFRLAYVRLREDDVLATPDDAVGVAGGRLPARARGGRRPGDVELRPRRQPVARRLHAGRAAARRGGRRRGRAEGRRGRRGSTPPRCGPVPPSRPPGCSSDCERAHDHARRPLPAGRPPDPRGDGLRAARRGQRLRRRVAGRQPPRARVLRADGGLRRGDRPDPHRLRRGRLLDPQPGPAGRHVLDARRPRSGPDHLRHRRVVGSAGGEGGHRPASARSR